MGREIVIGWGPRRSWVGDESFTSIVEITFYMTFLASVSSQFQSVPEMRVYKYKFKDVRNDLELRLFKRTESRFHNLCLRPC